MLSCRSLRASDLPVVQRLLHKPFDTIFLNSQNRVPWMLPIRIVIRTMRAEFELLLNLRNVLK